GVAHGEGQPRRGQRAEPAGGRLRAARGAAVDRESSDQAVADRARAEDHRASEGTAQELRDSVRAPQEDEEAAPPYGPAARADRARALRSARRGARRPWRPASAGYGLPLITVR